jgi:cold shock CspA family protein
VPQATVRWFDAERGFGFLNLGDDADDLFVHASEIVGDDNRKVLREGQEVEYELGEGDRGPQARRVRITGEYAADTPLGVLGTVSWYEPGKGYGFITPDSGDGEIFVHSSAIVGGGVVREGQRVAFMVVPGEKGPQAEHLLPLGAQVAPAGAAAAVADGADGTITFYDADKGFGFATRDTGGEDVFVHAKELVGATALAEGDRITFSVAESDRGPQARGVRLVGGAARRGPSAGPARGRTERPRSSAGPRSSGAPARGGQGVVARYDADRGFGFITPDAGGDDLFVHVSVVRGGEALYEGDRVRFEVRQSDRGPQADRVELL